jgi:hypothetical protein
MMRVFYGMGKGNARRYQCRGDDAHVGAGLCIGIGGVRVDRTVALQNLDAGGGASQLRSRITRFVVRVGKKAHNTRLDVSVCVDHPATREPFE